MFESVADVTTETKMLSDLKDDAIAGWRIDEQTTYTAVKNTNLPAETIIHDVTVRWSARY